MLVQPLLLCTALKLLTTRLLPTCSLMAEGLRVQRFAAQILQYIRDNLKTGQSEIFESVIRYKSCFAALRY